MVKKYLFTEEKIFKEVSDLLFKTNIFSILKLDSTEIRHTNMIEWLLTLNNYQGLKELIKIHKKMNIDVESIDTDSIIFYNDKPFSFIFQESNLTYRPDLIINFKCNNNNYYILIENKINAYENEYYTKEFQTDKYYKEINGMNIKNVFYIFLDAKRNDPRCSEYERLDYHDFYNKIMKNIKLENKDELFIYKQYCNSLMKPVLSDNDIMLDTIYAIDNDKEYEKIYGNKTNEYIKEFHNIKEHSEKEIKDYLVIKYIYYCIDYNKKQDIDPNIKKLLFGTKKRNYKWMYNGVYSFNSTIVKKLCIDLINNNEKELLEKISKIKIQSESLVVHDIKAIQKEWENWLIKHKATIDDYYTKLSENFYVYKYIPYETMKDISKAINNPKYEIKTMED